MIRDLLRVDPGSALQLVDIDPRSTPGTDLGKKAAKAATLELGPRLADLQERLYSGGRTGSPRRVLIVLQGMDTSGKGGAVKHVAGLVNPAGVRITGFDRPTEEELAHDFLWRVEKALPPAGAIGVFDRSHYEDVLIVRVHDLVPQEEWETRYDRINDPTKHWKVDPGDLDERRHWHAYQTAYEAVLGRCSTEVAPWYVVPADRKWYRNWALAHLLLETLEDLQLTWPQPGLDLAGMRAALSG